MQRRELGELYLRLLPRLRLMAGRMSGGREGLFDDFLGLAGLALVEAAGRYDEAKGTKLEDWLQLMAFSRVSDERRKQVRRESLLRRKDLPPHATADRDLWFWMRLDLSKDALLVASWLACYEGPAALERARNSLCPEPLTFRRFWDAAHEIRNYLGGAE